MRIAHIHADAEDAEGRLCAELIRSAQAAGNHGLLYYAYGSPAEDISACRVGESMSLRRKKRIPGSALPRLLACSVTGLFSLLQKQLQIFLLSEDRELHLLRSRLTDRSGFYSKWTTKRLIRQLEAYHPDVVHLHRLHGYYLNLPILFNYLKKMKIPVVWSMRDCWAFTGHCTWFTGARLEPEPVNRRNRAKQELVWGCNRWVTGCWDCPLKNRYPKSAFLDQCQRNWREKQALFSDLPYFVVSVPSQYLMDQVQSSFLRDYQVYCIQDSLDTELFTPLENEERRLILLRYYQLEGEDPRPLILAAANRWDDQSGLEDLLEVADQLGEAVRIAVAGFDDRQRQTEMPENIQVLRPVQSDRDMAALLSLADLVLIPSHGADSPLLLLKAMACGTPVVCYETTGFQEILTPETGLAVERMNPRMLARTALYFLHMPKPVAACRENALQKSTASALADYLCLYEQLYRFGPACSGADAHLS